MLSLRIAPSFYFQHHQVCRAILPSAVNQNIRPDNEFNNLVISFHRYRGAASIQEWLRLAHENHEFFVIKEMLIILTINNDWAFISYNSIFPKEAFKIKSKPVGNGLF